MNLVSRPPVGSVAAQIVPLLRHVHEEHVRQLVGKLAQLLAVLLPRVAGIGAVLAALLVHKQVQRAAVDRIDRRPHARLVRVGVDLLDVVVRADHVDQQVRPVRVHEVTFRGVQVVQRRCAAQRRVEEVETRQRRSGQRAARLRDHPRGVRTLHMPQQPRCQQMRHGLVTRLVPALHRGRPGERDTVLRSLSCLQSEELRDSALPDQVDRPRTAAHPQSVIFVCGPKLDHVANVQRHVLHVENGGLALVDVSAFVVRATSQNLRRTVDN